MATKKYTYRVKPGHRWGPFHAYGPGKTVELTVEEAEGFLDSLELVKGDNAPDEDPADERAYLNTLTIGNLKNFPEWEKVEPPRPTAKAEIVDAILAVREAK